ncbi:unnamed protein product [Penicillium manginii]
MNVRTKFKCKQDKVAGTLREIYLIFVPDELNGPLPPACSWTSERKRCCSHESRIKLFYEASDRGVWSLGSRLVLKDRGPMGFPTREVQTTQFVQEKTSITVPTIVDSWEEDGHTLILMKRIPGESLHSAWPKLSTAEKENIAQQTAESLLQLRDLHSDRIQVFGGRPVYACFLFPGSNGYGYPHGPFATDDELWGEMERCLDKDVPEAARIRLRSRMPPATPYTFTHGDLTDQHHGQRWISYRHY